MKIFKLFLAAAALLFVASLQTQAATFIVRVGQGGNFYSPASVTIAVGDTVTWTNVSGSHNVVCEFPEPVCGTKASQQSGNWTYSFTYTTVGTHRYRCTPHSSSFTSGMIGSVTVQAPPNSPPTVSITSPANGATFFSPATFTVQANASDSGGSITNVQFLAGTTVLGNDTSAPYQATASSLAAGTYTLRAIASDNNGAKATNAVTITVSNPPAIVLTTPSFQNGTMQFGMQGLVVGRTSIVQFSTNLPLFTPLFTNVATNSVFSFRETNATNGLKIFRVLQLP